MIPSISQQVSLGDLHERRYERRRLQAIERAELNLPPLSSNEKASFRAKQSEVMDKLSVPFARRKNKLKAVDVLDIRLAQRKREGPLPVDEEVAEENAILEKQLLKLRQTGLPAAAGSGGGDSPLNSSDTFLTGLTTSGSFAGSPSSTIKRTGSAAGSHHHHQQQQQQQQQPYAGDILFRPGRVTQNLEPTEFWFYARQKVTQRTLGTAVLQHPVVVGSQQGAEGAQSLRALIARSPIMDSIKAKVQRLFAQIPQRTRCGILFDLLSTRNIIVSGIPNVVGRLVYEFVDATIKALPAEHAASLRFTFVGITDNSNCCTARDVFCQFNTLAGKNIAAQKRHFGALDNTHLFAVPPGGMFEDLLGPAVGDGSGNGNRGSSSPLGRREWHNYMKKTKYTAPDPLGQFLRAEVNESGNTNKTAAAAAATENKQDCDDADEEAEEEGYVMKLRPEDVREAFDRRDYKFLPNVLGDNSDADKWALQEIAALRRVQTGPTVALGKMTKRYNAEAPMMKRMSLSDVLDGSRAAPSAMSRARSRLASTPSPGTRI